MPLEKIVLVEEVTLFELAVTELFLFTLEATEEPVDIPDETTPPPLVEFGPPVLELVFRVAMRAELETIIVSLDLLVVKRFVILRVHRPI